MLFNVFFVFANNFFDIVLFVLSKIMFCKQKIRVLYTMNILYVWGKRRDVDDHS